LDSDPHHLEIRISFSDKPGKKKVKNTLQFRAPRLKDYNRWMFVLGHFGLQQEIPGLDVEMRGNLTRAFSWKEFATGPNPHNRSKINQSRMSLSSHGKSNESMDSYFFRKDSCVDDMDPANRAMVSDSNVMSDDDALEDALSTMLDAISPCNGEWCRKVGLEPKKKAMRRMQQ